MRYAFDNESISLINRVYAAMNGTPLRDYGKMPALGYPLVASLWVAADIETDWNGEFENAEELYPTVKRCYEASIGWDRADGTMSDEARQTEDAMHDGFEIAFNFENKVYLAILVVNAMMAIENSSFNIFAMSNYPKAINEEFVYDRVDVEKQVIMKIRENAVFGYLSDILEARMEELNRRFSRA